MRIVAIGEVLWDVFEGSEKLGGAPFNFSVHASRLGHHVTFVSAVGDDSRGRRALACARELGLDTAFIRTVRGAPTGAVSVRVDPTGQPDFTIHRPAAYDAVSLDAADLGRLAAIQPDWLYYGTLHQAEAAARAQTRQLAEALPGARRFYDINLRRHSYTPELVAELLAASLCDFTRSWLRQSAWTAVAVTRGALGCAIRIGTDYAEPPGYAVKVADTVGAGDAFAAGLLHGLSERWNAHRTGDFANRVGAVVASRPGGVPAWTMEDCRRLDRENL